METRRYHLTLIKYIVGFGLSLITTLVAYYLVAGNHLHGNSLILWLGVLAVAQFLVQLVFFLHITDEGKPRLKFIAFLFMVLVLLLVVGGSLWIMHHLNDNMMQMSPGQKEQQMYIERDKGY